jgi:uncharacterized membrane protein YeaQ/YmgE (transglycosylase-associated protein family)
METATLEAQMEATRERLAGTIDQLVYRTSPKTIVRREITSIKGYFVDLRTGQPRTTNILKVVGGVVGTAVLIAVVRKVASD